MGEKEATVWATYLSIIGEVSWRQKEDFFENSPAHGINGVECQARNQLCQHKGVSQALNLLSRTQENCKTDGFVLFITSLRQYEFGKAAEVARKLAQDCAESLSGRSMDEGLEQRKLLEA
jgi:hypothetical protein